MMAKKGSLSGKRVAGRGLNPGNKAAALSERGDDLYETPPEAVWALIEAEGDNLPDTIWEPACGPGAIVRVLRASGRVVYATDLVDYKSRDQDSSGWDFLMELQLPLGVKAIITNPPFKSAAVFALKALELCPTVYMLLRLAFLEAGNLANESSVARRRVLDELGLARVMLFRKRLPMMHRAGWEGRKANSGMAFAWFKWERGRTAPATIERISWKPLTEKHIKASRDELSPTPLFDKIKENVNALPEEGGLQGGDNIKGRGRRARKPRPRQPPPQDGA